MRRLLGSDKYADGSTVLHDSYRKKNAKSAQQSQITLTWTKLRDDFNRCLKTYQVPVITEFATLGLSCVLVEKRAELEFTEVTLRGERADYWLGDKELLLEVSGQQSGDLDQLHAEKAEQLKENPFEKDGYVCVANYETKQAQLWYHAHE